MAKTNKREPLSIEKIQKLAKLFKQALELLNDFKKKDELGEHIKLPQVPKALSESLTVYLLANQLILPELKGYQFDFGGNVADIKAIKNGQLLKIEVKATGPKDFQEFGEKDIRANYLIWIRFGDYLGGAEMVEVLLVKNPNKYFDKPVKIDVDKFKKIVGKTLKICEVGINNLGG